MTLIWIGVLVCAGLIWYGYDLPDISDMQLITRRASITMLDSKGTILATYGDVYGDPIEAKDLPAHVINALLATEDRRFFTHFGLDIIGLTRAAWANYKANRVVQGGSTITQQLAKNFLQAKKLYTPRDRSLRRKIQEAIMALWLELRFSKEQILTLYLNRVYFGGGTYGIDGAAWRYYRRPAKDLSLYEAAVLAGLLKAPSRYSPANNPNLADQRARQVLQRMVRAKFIEPQAITVAMALASPPPEVTGNSSVRYFTDWIFDTLSQDIGELDQDLEITTTLDLDLQTLAEEQAQIVMATQKWHAEQIALITMTPQGEIKAMIGGLNYDNSKFNRTTQALRQPGSVFKYFVFLAALENGSTPETLIDDSPIVMGQWRPRNWLYQPQGKITLKQAFAKSVNSATIRLGMETGLPKVIRLARRLGITTHIPQDMTITLGSCETTLLEMTGAFAVISNNGIQVKPHGILEVRNRQGEILFQYKRPTTRLLDPTVAQFMHELLQAVITEGTGRSARVSQTCGGKTGTSQAYRDSWFIGYGGHLVTGVWSGIDSDTPMNRATGGSPSTNLWKRFMERALKLPETPELISHYVEDQAPDDEIGHLLELLGSNPGSRP